MTTSTGDKSWFTLDEIADTVARLALEKVEKGKAKPDPVEPVKQGIPPFSFREPRPTEMVAEYLHNFLTAMTAHYNEHIVGKLNAVLENK
jgi:hypothetical protein